MGLFGTKKVSPEKDYRVCYKKFPSKKVGVEELEKAVIDWEAAEGPQKEIWKAYFKMAIACDCGNKVAMNVPKGKAYHEKVRTIIDGSGDDRWKEWADSFYYWYGQSAINYMHELDAQTVNIRRLGNAAIHAVGLTGYAFMLREIYDALLNIEFGCLEGRAAETAKAFEEYIKFCTLYRIDNKTEMLEDRNQAAENFELDKYDIQKFYERAQEEKDIPNSAENWSDLHQYIFGLGLVLKAPLCFSQKFKNPQDSYIVTMVNAVFTGNVMALHKLVIQSFSSPEDHKFVEEVCAMSEGALNSMLQYQLENAEKAGDYTAAELLNRYFPNRVQEH